MWTYLIGPLAALLPRRWRQGCESRHAISWIPAAFISGLGEFLAGVCAFVYWYSYSVTHWARLVIFSTTAQHPEAAVPEGTEGFAALTLLALHPLSWLIAGVMVEGAIRFASAAFVGTVVGSLPLYVVEQVWVLRGRRKEMELTEGPDEISVMTDGEDEILEIASCVDKPGWDPPKVVHWGEHYYRLESRRKERTARPFVFWLRRLTVGVASPLVLEYRPRAESVVLNRMARHE